MDCNAVDVLATVGLTARVEDCEQILVQTFQKWPWFRLKKVF